MATKNMVALDIESLALVDDGSLAIAFRQQMLLLARDIANRPKLDKKRKFSIVFEGSPLVNGEGELRGVSIEAQVIPVKIPNYCTVPIAGKVNANGIQFDPDTVDSADSDDA